MAAKMFGTPYENKKYRGLIKDGVPYYGQDLGSTRAASYAAPAGYELIAEVSEQKTFDTPTDLAYGADGKFAYKKGFTGTIRFDDDTFGDPAPGVVKAGYAKASTLVVSSGSKKMMIGGLLIVAAIIGVIWYRKHKK